MNETTDQAGSSFRIESLLHLFCKVLALIFIGFTILRWMQIIGFADPQVRFDTMSNDMRWAIAYLGVVQPVAALGLWSGLAWGYVVWAMAAAGELLFLSFTPEGLFAHEGLLMLHAASAIVFLLAMILTTARNLKGA